MMRNSNVLLNLAVTFATALGLTLTAAGQSNAPIALQLSGADQIPVANTAFHADGNANGKRSSVVSSTLKPIAAGTNEGGNPRGFFPADLSHSPSGQTIMRAQHHLIYVNMPPSHWGDVAQFLTDFDQSDYIHILDQYVGAADNNRYTMGTSFTLTLPPLPAGTPLEYDVVLAIVHAAASYAGGGYGHIYHLLLPQGMATCASFGCYEPNNGARDFCAYHSSVTFSDSVGHAVFTVLPYAGVHGCEQPPSGTTHSQEEDSQNSFVAHETFEAITDPDADNWYVHTLDSTWGKEVADLCQKSQLWSDGYYYGSAQNIQLNGHWWTVPGMYSNRNHGCAFSSTQ
jgi:hypothetical protein